MQKRALERICWVLLRLKWGMKGPNYVQRLRGGEEAEPLAVDCSVEHSHQ